MADRRDLTTALDEIGPETAASLLRTHGVGLIAEDHHLIEALMAAGIARSEIPADLAPTRAVLARLMEGAIRNPFDPAHLACVSTQSRALAERLAARKRKG